MPLPFPVLTNLPSFCPTQIPFPFSSPATPTPSKASCHGLKAIIWNHRVLTDQARPGTLIGFLPQGLWSQETNVDREEELQLEALRSDFTSLFPPKSSMLWWGEGELWFQGCWQHSETQTPGDTCLPPLYCFFCFNSKFLKYNSPIESVPSTVSYRHSSLIVEWWFWCPDWTGTTYNLCDFGKVT